VSWRNIRKEDNTLRSAMTRQVWSEVTVLLVLFVLSIGLMGTEACDRYTVCNKDGCRNLVLVCSRETFFLNSKEEHPGFGEKLVGGDGAEPVKSPIISDQEPPDSDFPIKESIVVENVPRQGSKMDFFALVHSMVQTVTMLMGGLACLASFLFLFKEINMGICVNKRSLVDRVAIVTGASQGMGLDIARQLASRGALVVVASRNRQRGGRAAEKIRADTGNRFVRYVYLDLTSFDSVRRFVEEFKIHNDVLDYLVNNAAVIAASPAVSEDVLDATMQTNFLGHFLLTNLLEPLLRSSSDPRVINVSSLAHYAGNLPNIDALADPSRSSKSTKFAVRTLTS